MEYRLLQVKHILKHQKIGPGFLAATSIIAFAMMVRLILVLMHWPPTNSDEGTMYIMAYNIAYHGAWPLNFYHQAYMGPIEAYLGALLFHLTGGPSYTALRFGVLFLVTLFFISIYHLSRLVYSRSLALVTIAALSIGSIPYLTRQTIATGGSTQTLLFGTLAFLLAFWLSSTSQDEQTVHMSRRHLLGYAAFGLDVGVGLWSDMIILPSVLLASLLLCIFCWRDLLHRGKWLVMLFFILLGFLPCLVYNAMQGTNPIITLFNLIHGTGSQAPIALPGLWHNLVSTVQISLPTATGLPFCPVLEYPFLGDNTPPSLHCDIIHTTWGLGYLALASSALISTGVMLRLLHLYKDKKLLSIKQTLQNEHSEQVKQAQSATIIPSENHRDHVQQMTRFLLICMVFGTLFIYIPSSGPVDEPGYHARYLIGLLIATPAIISPLWHTAALLFPLTRWQRLRIYASRLLLTLLAATLIVGTYRAFREVPAAHTQQKQYEAVAHHLEELGVTRFYADYWVCYNVMIITHFRLICSVIDSGLTPNHERDQAGRLIVNNTGHSSWMCAKDLQLTMPEYDCLPALEELMRKIPPYQFHRYEFDGYVLYKSTRSQVQRKPMHPLLP